MEQMVSRRVCGALGLVVALAVLPGCAGKYFQHRLDDAIEMGDIGVTFSKKPHWSVYGCAAGLASAGAGHVDGKFIGVGGGQVGQTKHYHKALGLLAWSFEEIGWGEFDITKPETLYIHHPGLLGYLVFLPRRPAYAPGCMHILHLGYVGLMFNLRYMEMVDFVAGWTTFDLAGDDGDRFGHWFWQKKGASNLPKRIKLPY